MISLKRSTKLLSLLLSLLILFSPVFALGAGAVNYPSGITKEQTASVIPKLNNLVKTLMASGSENIKDSLYATLFSDETLNGLFKEIYTALGENADSLSIIGVDISPAALAEHLSAYPSISKKVASCNSLSAVIKASQKFVWGVSSKNDFGKALAAMLSPFNALLNALLCSGTVQINSILAIKGDDGYANAIVPLLSALDCPNIMSSAEFSADAAKNHRRIIRNIVDMLFLSIDKLIDDPVKGLCNTLPKVAYYIKSGKLSDSITKLLEPLSLKIAGIFTIAGISDLISGAANLEDSFNIDELMGSIDISTLLGSDVKLQLPEIDLQELASCVTDSNGTLTTDQAAAFIVIMNYLLDAVKSNKDSLGSLLGADESMTEMLEPLLSKTNDEIIATIINLFSATSIPENNYQWTYPSVTTTPITYTPVFTADDYAKFIEKVDPLITDFIKESDPEGNIEDTLRKTIYSNSLLSMLIKGIFSMIGSEETAPLFALLGLDVTPSGIANAVYSYVPSTANYLYRCSSWEKVNPDYLAWGFRDGDSEGFTKALTRILTPFIPLLSCILAGQNVTLLDAITIPGANGYNTAVIPLLEALGCNTEDIKTYEEYKKGAGTNAVLTDILVPVTALLDRICAAPVKTLCTILPNLVYFFDSGLMNSALENLIYPISKMLENAGMSDLLDSVFSQTEETDLNGLVSSLTSGIDLGITLPQLDITVLGTLGTLTSYQSKRVVNGAYANYSYLVSDSPAVFLTILRFVAKVLTMEENSGLLSGLMESPDSAPSEDGMPDMFAMFAGNITAKLSKMTQDEIIEWLCDLLFSDSPIAELPVEDEEIPTIIYKEKFKLSTTAKIIILLLVIGIAALVYYILSVSGKLDNYKLRRRKQQEMKRREKEREALIKAGASLEDLPPEPDYKEPDKKSFGKKKSAKKDSDEINKISEKQAKIQAYNETKDERIARSKLPDSKQTEKLAKRQQSAVKTAQKNELKNQKYYEKAVQQAAKKKQSKEG